MPQPSQVGIDYDGDWDHLQIRFLHGGVPMHENGNIRYNKTQVQLYSKELRSGRNPFPVASKAISENILSPTMMRKVQRWIDHCIGYHDKCSTYAHINRTMPSRLIKLSGDGNAYLMSTKATIKYAALSYCWGSSKQSMTIRSNLRMRYNELEICRLPRTIQDAILIIKGLGLGYLWADSVCIVQDDKIEWAVEAAKMADVYSNAHIVLAATATHDANDGFINVPRRALSIVTHAGPEESFTVEARVVQNHEHFGWDETSLDHYPLSRRGWALQERILAIRTLHFLPDEVLFECKSGLACECGRVSFRDELSPVTWPPAEEDFEPLLPMKFQFAHKWFDVVEMYKGRLLTYADDALPAFSGIARRTLPLKPGRYFAGLWEKSIAMQLCWLSVETHDLLTKSGQWQYHPQPTFSWVSAAGKILWPSPWVHALSQPICTLLHGHSLEAVKGSYGQTMSASLRMRGRIVKGPDMVGKILCMDDAELENQNHDDGSLYRPGVNLDIGPTFILTGSILPPRFMRYQGLKDACDWTEVVCFGLCLNDERHTKVAMLLLQPVPQTSSFIRIGVVLSIPRQWFDSIATDCIVAIV